jgi:hypothetical protein
MDKESNIYCLQQVVSTLSVLMPMSDILICSHSLLSLISDKFIYVKTEK